METAVIGLLLSFFLAWTGFLIGAVRWLLDRSQRHLDDRFVTLEKSLQLQTHEWQRVERDLLELRATLPNAYLAREDWIRFMGVFDRKIDVVFDRLNAAGGRRAE